MAVKVRQMRELLPARSVSSTKDVTALMEDLERHSSMEDNVKRPTHLDALSTLAMGKETLGVAIKVQIVSTGTHDCAMSRSEPRNVRGRIARSFT